MWEETVMSEEQISLVLEPLEECPQKRDNVVAKAQAEISYKAGEEQGVKKVVDWVNEHTYGGLSHMHSPEWQAFLKSIGGEQNE